MEVYTDLFLLIKIISIIQISMYRENTFAHNEGFVIMKKKERKKEGTPDGRICSSTCT